MIQNDTAWTILYLLIGWVAIEITGELACRYIKARRLKQLTDMRDDEMMTEQERFDEVA